MRRARRVLILALTIALLSAGLARSQASQAPKPDSELLLRLKALPGVVEAKEARSDGSLFRESYERMFEQPANLVLCPDGIPIVYDSRPMADVYHFLQYHGDRIIYIYGELDPWSSTGIQLIGRTDAVKIVVKNGYHGSRVRDFSPEQKELFYATLERWLGLTLPREVPK